MKKLFLPIIITSLVMMGAITTEGVAKQGRTKSHVTVVKKKATKKYTKKSKKRYSKRYARHRRANRNISREEVSVRTYSVLRQYLPELADLYKAPSVGKISDISFIPVRLDQSSAFSNSAIRKALLRNFFEWKRAPYRYGGKSPNGVDCSGFTSTMISNTLNWNFAGDSRWQAQQFKKISDTNSLQFGDLMFFGGRSRRGNRIGHVGIYIGNGVFMHSSSRKGVTCSHIDEAYYRARFRHAGRIPMDAQARYTSASFTNQ